MPDKPRVLQFGLGRVCEAGQHAPCPGVGDPYDSEPSREPVWVCSCECHWPYGIHAPNRYVEEA